MELPDDYYALEENRAVANNTVGRPFVIMGLLQPPADRLAELRRKQIAGVLEKK